MKRVLSCIIVVAMAMMLMAIPASAAYTMEDALASDKVYRGTPGKIVNGVIDSIWDKAVEYELEGRLPEADNRIRPGLKVTFKHLWDNDNFYYLVKVVGDKDVTVGGNKLIGSFYADKTNLLLVTPIALEDEEYPQYYAPTYAGRTSDVSLKIHRDNPKTAPEGGSWETSDWIMPTAWKSKDLLESSATVIPQVLDSLSIYETGDEEETYYVQAAIPWKDKDYAKSGNMIGIDVSYEDNMYNDLCDYLGLARKTANCYYAEGYGESTDVPLLAEPRVLSDLSVNIDKSVSDVILAIEHLNSNKITIRDKQTVANIRAKYELLSDDQKALVTNYGILDVIDARIAVLEEAKVEGNKVFQLIKALPDKVTLEDEAAVKEARKAYDALNADQKIFVTNLNKLQNAENEIAVLNGTFNGNNSNFNNNGGNNNNNNGGNNNNGNSNTTNTTPNKPSGSNNNGSNIPTTKDGIIIAVIISLGVLLTAAAVLLPTGRKLLHLNKTSEKN